MLNDQEEINYLQRILQCIVQFHNGCLVATAVAVVRRTEDCHHVSIMTPVVALQTNVHIHNVDPGPRITENVDIICSALYLVSKFLGYITCPVTRLALLQYQQNLGGYINLTTNVVGSAQF